MINVRRPTKPNATFESYRRAVDLHVSMKCGLTLADLPDVPLVDWWETSVPISIAARRAIGGEAL